MKIVIFKKNSPWGVLKVPQKGNIYRHCLTFLDTQNRFSQRKKDEFINDYLADDGKTYLQMLADQIDQPWEPQNELIFNFKANAKSQKNRMSYREIQLSDFCMTQDESGEILFWTLKVLKTEANFISFEAEIDIFFSYHIEFRDNSKNNIHQGHVDRWNVKGQNITPNFAEALKTENTIDAPLIIKKNQSIIWDEQSSGDIHSAQKRTYVEKIWAKLKWIILYVKNDAQKVDGSGDLIDESYQISKLLVQGKTTNWPRTISLPYSIILMPYDYSQEINSYYYTMSKSENLSVFQPRSAFSDEPFFDLIRKDAKNIIGCHILDHLPVNLFNKKPLSPRPYIRVWNEKINLRNTLIFMRANLKEYIVIRDEDPPNYFFLSNIVKLKIDDFMKSKLFNMEKPSPPNSSISLLQAVQKKYEIKFWCPQFRKYKINSWNNPNETFYYYPFIKQENGQFRIKSMYSFNPENYKMLYWFESIIEKAFENHKITVHQNNIEVPLGSDAYITYLRENRNQLATGRKFDNIRKNLGVAGMVSGMIGSVASKNPLGFAGSIIGGVGAITSANQNLENRESKLADLENVAPTIQVGNNFIADVVFSSETLKEVQITEITPHPTQAQMTHDQFIQFGYIVKNLKNLDNATKSRYRFNYIQADDVFNSIKNKFSPSIKQTISSAFADGITFWHYRDKNTWKGIMSYEWENWENNVLHFYGKYRISK